MFGCHNCGMKPQGNKPYAKSACASCRARKDPTLLSYGPTDPADFQSLQVMHPAYLETRTEKLDDGYCCKEDLLAALSQTVRILMRMKENNPETYRVVEAKMDEPLLSYSQLAEKLSCRKQNIQYHLRRAVQICPELGYALIIDTRRVGGGRSRKNGRPM